MAKLAFKGLEKAFDRYEFGEVLAGMVSFFEQHMEHVSSLLRISVVASE